MPQGVGQALEQVVELVAHIAHAEAGFPADLLIFEIVVVFETDEVLVLGREFRDQ